MEPVVILEPIVVKVATAAKLLDCGQSTVNRLINAGKLDVIGEIGDRRVTMESIKRLLAPKVAA